MTDGPRPIPSGEAEATTPSGGLDLGADIRAMRKVRGLTLAALAAASGKSVGFLSQVERGRKNPSVGTLQAIAEALGVGIGWFFQQGEAADPAERAVVVRRRKRRRLSYTTLGKTDYLGMVDELLSPNLDGDMALVLTTYRPGASSGDELYVHGGEEAGLILSGTVDLLLGRRTHRLEAGDSFQFKSAVPHRYINRGDDEAQVLMVIAPVALKY
ncbi:MAG: cupin domain-containing protein [Proteobacteria bacterium]|nr:cupin domain-containing protein [Pseudomonadota bacterium]